MIELTNNDQYYIAEFLYAGHSDTLIKTEVLKVIEIFERFDLIKDPEEFKKPFLESKSDYHAKNMDEYLKSVVAHIEVDSDDPKVMELLKFIKIKIGGEMVGVIMNKYTTGNLTLST